MATSTGSSARKVLSSTRPVRTFFSLVRTKAPPLPGLTCWNSTTFMRSPSMFRVMPFFRSLVVAITALLRSAGRPSPCRHVSSVGAHPLQLEKLPGRGGQHVVAAGSDHRQVLDPDAAEAGKVDTGLHGHGRPWRDPTIGARAHPRGLVDLETDAVAAGVAEGVAEAGLADHLAAGSVDGRAADPGAERLQPGRQGPPDHLVDLPLALGGRPEHHGPGHVRAVAVHPRAEVQLDQIAGAQRPLARAVVRLGRLLAEGDDRVEGERLGAAAAHPDLQVDGDLELGHAGAQRAEQLVEGLAAEPGRLGDAGDLGLVLDL